MQRQKKVSSNQKLEMVLEYARAGFNVFPCKGLRYKGKEKQPLIKDWPHQATTDERTIRAWHAQWPNAWWAIPTDQFTVIDQDLKNGDGIEEMKILIGKWGELPKTRVHSTPSGGRHTILKRIPGIRNSVGKISPNIDIRGEGGYICVPPSEGYGVLVEVPWKKIAGAPRDWAAGLKELQKKKVVDIKTKEPHQRQKIVPEGQRNEFLVSMAGSMHNIPGMTEESIYAALRELRDNACAKSADPSDNISDGEIKNMAYREAFLNPEQYEVFPAMGEFDLEKKTLGKLYTRRFPAINWCIEGLLPEGLGITASRPKMGKSRLWWSFAYAVATGGKALNNFDVSQGKVLYIAVDDASERMIRDRCKTMGFKSTENLFYEVRDIPRIDENLIGYLTQWKEEEPDLSMVVLDTMAHIKPEKKQHQEAYDFETRVWKVLHEWCHDYHMHVHMIHHLRKTQTDEHVVDVLGSTGVTASVDVIVTVKQDKRERGAIVTVTGRETSQQILNVIMSQETGVWEYLNDGVQNKRSVSQGTLDVWEAVKDGPLSVSQVAEKLGKKVDATRRKLLRMERDGELKSVKQGKINLYYMGQFEV